jgi:serine/threonine-protein kinase HipA
MAAAAGIEMPAAIFLPSDGGGGYFGVRRFDRDGDQRFHVHSASGLLYADAKLPSLDYDDLLRLTRKMTRDQRACEEMYRRAVFNVLSHNRDDHARQFSFIMTADGSWRLSPAYDLTYSDGPGGEHSTSVRGKGKDISREDLRTLGRVAELQRGDADAVIDQVADAISDWPKRAGEIDVSRSSRNRIAAALKAVVLAGV